MLKLFCGILNHPFLLSKGHPMQRSGLVKYQPFIQGGNCHLTKLANYAIA
ncbi:MAG: hypothetical protein WA435_00530 [Gallionellaceae bacterium]